MITKLTKKQKEMITQVRDEYLAHYNSMKFDEKKARKLVKFLYQYEKNKNPKVFIMDSPLACQIAANAIKGGNIGSNIWDNIWSNIGSNIWSNIWGNIGDNIRDNIWDNIWDNIGSNIWSNIESNIRGNIGDNIRNNIRGNIWNNIWGNIGDNNKQFVYNSFSVYGDSSDYSFVAYYDYFVRMKLIQLDKETLQKFLEYKKLIKANIFMLIAFENAVFVSKPPIELNRDHKGRLHSTRGMAIRFRDGYGECYVNGVRFGKKLFKRAFLDKNMSAEDILALKNTEQKAAILSHGYAGTIAKAGRVIDTYQETSYVTGKPVRYELMETDIGGVAARFLMVEDHTTHKKTYLGLGTENIRTVRDALNFCANDDAYFDRLILRT